MRESLAATSTLAGTRTTCFKSAFGDFHEDIDTADDMRQDRSRTGWQRLMVQSAANARENTGYAQHDQCN